MKSFYFLKVQIQDIGVYPQMEKLHNGFHSDLSRQFALWEQSDPDKRPTAEGMKMKYKAKATDWVDIIEYNISEVMLISTRFYNLLQQYNRIPWIVAHAELEHRNKYLSYEFIHFPRNAGPEYIDYDATVFFATDAAGYWERDFKLPDSAAHYELSIQTHTAKMDAFKKREKAPDFGIKELHIRPDAPDLSILTLRMGRVVISQALKEAIEAAQLTGILFEPVSDYRSPYLKYSKPA